MKKTNKKIIYVLFLIINLLPYQKTAAEEAAGDVYIDSEEDLISLAERASLDTWSENKTIILNQDLDLTDIEFEGIPIFKGTFDGQDHTIKGLSMENDRSPQGLFRYVEKEGEIKNLNVEGKIKAEDSKGKVGGIVGSNKGTIKNSQFNGKVEGKQTVGGIVGINEESGIISNALMEGTVYGEHQVGGIAGENQGSILLSENQAKINTIVKDNSFSIKELEERDQKRTSSFSPVNIVEIIDVGGIAGLSDGIIQSSSNYGSIGYEQVGYNIGGIAGRQSGYVNDAINHGTIKGRKDIGGVVGQIEPYAAWDFSDSTLKQLREELETLDHLIDKGISDSSQFSTDFTRNFSEVKDHVGDARASSDDLADYGSNWLDENIETLNDLNVLFAQLANNVDPVLISSKNIIKESKEGLIQYKETIENSLDEVDEHFLASFDELIVSLDALEKDVDNVMESISALKKNINDKDELEKEIANVKTALADFINTLDDTREAGEELKKGISESDIEELAEADFLQKELEDLLNETKNISKELEKTKEVFENLDRNENENISVSQIETLIEALTNLAESSKLFSKKLSKTLASSADFLVELDISPSGDTEQKADNIRREMNAMQSSIKELRDMFANLAEDPQIQFEKLNPDFKASKENLFQALANISTSVSTINDSVSEGTNDLEDNAQAISDQLFIIFNLLIDTADDFSEASMNVKDHVEDISMEDVHRVDNGKVENSQNHGTVEGDINIGGITGSMAIEYDFDLEDDYTVTEIATNEAKYLLRAIILNSENDGKIIAKKDYAGGIAGLMDLGYIVQAVDHGEIESKDGNYVGGITGSAEGTISNSFAKSNLAGGDYVGGIAGYGKNIFESYSLVNITQGDEFTGAIAGDVNEIDQLEDNYFVHEEFAGVNEVSYKEKAEPITYEDLIDEDGIPTVFKEFELKFVVEEEELASVPFEYGESISEDQIPKFPEKDGYYGKWDKEDFAGLEFDETVTGEYKKYITTLASEEKRENDLSILLVDGEFTEDSKLLTEKIETSKINRNDNILEAWRISANDNQQKSSVVHYLPPENKLSSVNIYTQEDGGWEQAEVTENGSYLLFEMDKDAQEFLVTKSEAKFQKTYWLVGLFIAISGILYLFIRKRKNSTE